MLRYFEIIGRDKVQGSLVGRSSGCRRVLAKLSAVLANLNGQIDECHDNRDAADEVAKVSECFENCPAPAA